MPGSKTAKTIATGVWWRIGAAGVARWSNGKCFTLERSTTVSTKVGVERSKSSMTKPSEPCPWHYFRLIGSCRTSPPALACKYGSKRWNCIDLGSGEPVGWPAIFTSSWNWMSSGRSVWPTVGRGLAGSIFCKLWSAMDSLIRAANGGCIGSGLSKARWETCWMKIFRWSKERALSLLG